MNEPKANLAQIVWYLRDYFDRYEYKNYSTEIDPKYKISYAHSARKKFVDYYAEELYDRYKNVFTHNK